MTLQLVKGTTWHRRLGAVENSFRYRVDYVLVEPEGKLKRPALFSLNKKNFMAIHDRDHGGPRDAGRGAAWFRTVLADAGAVEADQWQVLLLAQPRMMGTKFSTSL